MTILDRIVDYKRTEELPRRMRELPMEAMQACAAAAPAPRDFIAGLRSAPGVALIAEVKQASPSKGLLRPDFDPVQLAATYASHGAAALSVLTDEPFFQGSLAYLAQIRQRLALPLEGGEQPRLVPLLRKDFIIHPYQVYEARAAGADALLLIAAILSEADLAQLLSLTRTLGMTGLVEVTSREELARVLPLAPLLVGVNNRDLRDFSVNLNTCLTLRPLVPPDICLVAESGIHTRADVARLAAAGVDAVLVGEALVTAPDVGAKVRELTGRLPSPTAWRHRGDRGLAAGRIPGGPLPAAAGRRSHPGQRGPGCAGCTSLGGGRGQRRRKIARAKRSCRPARFHRRCQTDGSEQRGDSK
jgi:indole-3-glycerol phosphate synthase